MAPRLFLACAAALVGAVLVSPLLLVLVPLWIVSAGTRALARLLEPAYLTRDQLTEFDPVFGWKPRANLHTHHLMADLFRISTDAQGWRGRSTLAESDIVVFGDSFAAGYGIGEEHLFANLSSRPRIKPIGIGGYSMVQELLWMRELAQELRGKLVVWFVYLGNDLYDNLSPALRGYRKPFVREVRGTDNWEVFSGHISRDKWPIVPRLGYGHIHMAKLAELCADTFLAQRAYRACEFLIRQGKQLCTDVGADLVVLTVPDSHQLTVEGHRYLRSLRPDLTAFDPNLPDRKIETLCRTVGAEFIAGTSFLDASCYKKNDCHWNALGHRRVAKSLVELHASWRRQRIGNEGKLPANEMLSRELNPAVKSTS